jgi:ATP-binding cassette subfamily B protein
MVPASQKFALAAAVVLMALTSASSTAIPLFLGRLVDAVNPRTHAARTNDDLLRVASMYLAMIGGAYLLRETLNVVRRYLVENACTRIDKSMCVRVVSHLMKVDLAYFTREQVGALNGRISRGVEGYVKFLRLAFLDFMPAILTGVFALVAAISKEPRIGFVMVGVIPVSLAMTLWQLMTQKGVRLDLLRSRENMDGTVVEQLSGIDYVICSRSPSTGPSARRNPVRRDSSTASRSSSPMIFMSTTAWLTAERSER